MVTVDALKHLLSDPEIIRRVATGRGTTLSDPGSTGMAERVRNYAIIETSEPASRPKALVDLLYRLTVPLDHEIFRDTEPVPTSKMGKEPRRQRHRWLAFLRLARAERGPMELSLT